MTSVLNRNLCIGDAQPRQTLSNDLLRLIHGADVSIRRAISSLKCHAYSGSCLGRKVAQNTVGQITGGERNQHSTEKAYWYEQFCQFHAAS